MNFIHLIKKIQMASQKKPHSITYILAKCRTMHEVRVELFNQQCLERGHNLNAVGVSGALNCSARIQYWRLTMSCRHISTQLSLTDSVVQKTLVLPSLKQIYMCMCVCSKEKLDIFPNAEISKWLPTFHFHIEGSKDKNFPVIFLVSAESLTLSRSRAVWLNRRNVSTCH